MEWPILSGVLINSALYLLCVIMAGFATYHNLAWQLGIAAFGVTYLSYYVQAVALYRTSWRPWHPTLAVILVAVSVILGVAAGLALLV